MRPQLLTDIIEAIKTHYESNPDLYLDVVGIFIREGLSIDDLEECFGVDDVLDGVLDEYLSSIEDGYDDEDDEWPDGGREDF